MELLTSPINDSLTKMFVHLWRSDTTVGPDRVVSKMLSNTQIEKKKLRQFPGTNVMIEELFFLLSFESGGDFLTRIPSFCHT